MKSAELKIRFEPHMLAWLTQKGNKSQFIRDLVAQAMRAEVNAAAGELRGQRFVHQKRGSIVTVLGTFEMQTSQIVVEGHKCVAYVHEGDKTQWVRPKAEFLDGRFIKVEYAGTEP